MNLSQRFSSFVKSVADCLTWAKPMIWYQDKRIATCENSEVRFSISLPFLGLKKEKIPSELHFIAIKFSPYSNDNNTKFKTWKFWPLSVGLLVQPPLRRAKVSDALQVHLGTHHYSLTSFYSKLFS